MNLFKSSAKIGLMIIAIISLNFSFINKIEAATESEGVLASYLTNPDYQDKPNYLYASMGLQNTNTGEVAYFAVTNETIFPEGYSAKLNFLNGTELKVEYEMGRVEGLEGDPTVDVKKALKIYQTTITARPDFIVENYLVAEPAKYSGSDKNYYVNVKMTNYGSVGYHFYVDNLDYTYSYALKSANGSVKNNFDKYSFNAWSYFDFDAGESKITRLSLPKDQLEAGDRLTVTIDPLNAVTERDETNNELTFDITQPLIDELKDQEFRITQAELDQLSKKPDLKIDYVFYTMPGYSNPKISFSMKNNGTLDIANNSKEVTVSITVTDKNGNIRHATTHGFQGLTLKINQAITADINFKVLAEDTITVKADSKNVIKESDENNNSKSVTVPLERKVFEPKTTTEAKKLLNNLKGKIVLQVEQRGEAYYYSPKTSKVHYLQDGASAYQIMREAGLGISEEDYKELISTSDAGQALKKRLAGHIVLRVQKKGEAYYINPKDLRIYYMADGADAYRIMREQSLGIADKDLSKIIELDVYKDWKKYLNSEAGVSFYYPKSAEYKLDVEITNLSDYPAGPWGDGKQNALADQAALAKGQYGRNISWFDPYQSVVKLAGGVKAKQYTSLGAFDVCDIHFSKALIFYHNNKEIKIYFVINPGDYDFHSAGYDKIYKEMSKYFVKDKNNCPDLMWIPDTGKKDFLTDLKNHRGKGLAQEWTNNFKKIIESIELK